MNISEYRKEYLSKLGAEIRSLRESKGMSQDDLAQLCGYKSRSSINKIEKGVYDVPLPKIKPLANALGVTPIHFLGIEVEERYTMELSPEEESILNAYRSLNDKGKAKAVDYIADLTESKKYTEKGTADRNFA